MCRTWHYRAIRKKFDDYYACDTNKLQDIKQEIIDELKQTLMPIVILDTQGIQNAIRQFDSSLDYFKRFGLFKNSIPFDLNKVDENNKKCLRSINDINTIKTHRWAIERNIVSLDSDHLYDRLYKKLEKINQQIDKYETAKKQLRAYASKHELKLQGNNDKLLEALKHLQHHIQSYCKNINVNKFKDLASTLLFVAIKDKRCLIGHLGDGVIGAWYGEELKVISEPHNGGHANETYFVTMKDSHKALKMIKGDMQEKNITAFVLMSDGGADGLYQKRDKKLIPLLQDLINEAKAGADKTQEIKDLIERVKNEKTTNDCSIAILYEGK